MFKTSSIKKISQFLNLKESPTQVFYFEYCNIFENSFLRAISERLFLKKCCCYNGRIIFSSEHVLERHIDWCIKNRSLLFTNCRQFPGFLSNSIRLYSIKLKIGMPYHKNNTFRNTILKIYANLPSKVL